MPAKVILESSSLEVYTRTARRHQLLARISGQWIRVKATIFDNGIFMIRAVGGLSYEKVMPLRKEMTISVATVSGRPHCLIVKDGEHKRVLNCGTVDRRHEWQTTLMGACTRGNKKKKKQNVIRAAPVQKEPPRIIKKRSLESFLQWHEECFLYESFKRASKARRAWWRAMDAVAKQVLHRRHQAFGYSSFALIRLHRKILELDHGVTADIKRKARRILRVAIRELRDKKKPLSTWTDIVTKECNAKGVAIAPSPNSNTSSPTPTVSSTSGSGQKKKRWNQQHKLSRVQNESVFKEKMQGLLRRERVLPNLTRTLELIRRKDRSEFDLADSLRGLWVARCVRVLLNLPGGLAALLAMSQERGSLRRLLVAALLCRVPLLTVLVLEMLAAFAVLPGTEGTAVVTNVLAQLDRSAQWGRPLCSEYLLRASPEALRWSPQCPRNPPPFTALATLLADSPEHTCCPDLKGAVITLFAALCNSQTNRSAAQWVQTRIFLACRASLHIEATPTTKRSVPNPAVAKAKHSIIAEIAAKEASMSDSSPVPPNQVSSKTRARRRRATLGKKEDDDSTVGEDEDLHPCPPLLGALMIAKMQDDDVTKLYAMQLEHFLDGWDQRELDEADEIDELPIGSSDRIDLLAERIRRSALLLGRYLAVDDTLNALGLDLEHAAFLPFKSLIAASRAAADDSDEEDGRPRVALELSATAAAVARLRGEVTSFKPTRPRLESQSSETKGPALCDDPRYAKYFKMIKMHVPRMAVGAKMANEGLDPAVLDMDPLGPAPVDSPEKERPPVVEKTSPEPTTKAEPLDDESLGILPLGCGRAPTRKLRRAFFDVITDTEGTIWHDIHGLSSDSKQEEGPEEICFLSGEALDDLELVFGPTRREQLGRDQDEIQTPVQQVPINKRPSEKKEPLRNLVAEALGEKRAFALNLLYGSLRISNDECVNAVAALDPDDEVFVKHLPRLGTLYNIVGRKNELQRIETAAQEAGILTTSSIAPQQPHGLRRRSSSSGVQDPSPEGTTPQLEMKLDGLSDLMVSLIDRARRPRGKVRALWLYASVKDQCADIATKVKNFEAATKAVTKSESLKTILKVVLAVTNFLNHGTQRGQSRGIRVSALTKLRATKTTPAPKNESLSSNLMRSVSSTSSQLGESPPCKNLLQFVVRHAGVSAKDLKAEIPPSVLRTVYNGPQRSAIASQLDDLRTDRDDAANERAVLSREATHSGGETRQVAVAAAAAARMAHIVADVDDELEKLKNSFATMDDAVDAMLQSFGEPPTTFTATDWLKDLDTFISQYDVEYNDIRDHLARKERRDILAKKQQARATFLSSSPEKPPTTPTSSSEAPADDVPDDGKPVKEFDKFVENAARAALVDQTRYSSKLRSFATQADAHLTVLTEAVDCAECHDANSSTTPGAFAIHGTAWYCEYSLCLFPYCDFLAQVLTAGSSSPSPIPPIGKMTSVMKLLLITSNIPILLSLLPPSSRNLRCHIPLPRCFIVVGQREGHHVYCEVPQTAPKDHLHDRAHLSKISECQKFRQMNGLGVRFAFR